MARPAAFRFIRTAQLVGGLGVTGDGIRSPILDFRAENPSFLFAGYDKDEDIALAGQHGYAPSSAISATNVFINGIRLPYVDSSTIFSNTTVPRGNADSRYPIRSAPRRLLIQLQLSAECRGKFASQFRADPLPGRSMVSRGSTAAEVTSILSHAAHADDVHYPRRHPAPDRRCR